VITKKTIGAFLAGVSILPLFLMAFAQSGNIIELDFIDWQTYGLSAAMFLIAGALMFFWEKK
jgi:uncharacterized membrane protein